MMRTLERENDERRNCAPRITIAVCFKVNSA